MKSTSLPVDHADETTQISEMCDVPTHQIMSALI